MTDSDFYLLIFNECEWLFSKGEAVMYFHLEFCLFSFFLSVLSFFWFMCMPTLCHAEARTGGRGGGKDLEKSEMTSQ